MLYREFHSYKGELHDIVAVDEADMHKQMMLIDRMEGCPDEKNRWIECYNEDMKLKNRLKRSMRAVMETICLR